MALRKTFTKRFLDCCKTTSQTATLEHIAIFSAPHHAIVPPNAFKIKFHREYLTSLDSAHRAMSGRFLHRRAVYHSSPTKLTEILSLPLGEKLRERLSGINLKGDLLRLDRPSPPAREATDADSAYGIAAKDARKILRLSQMEKLKAKLREIPKTSISYSEYMRICVDACENVDQGAEFAKMLDKSGNVIVLGNVVFLRPEQVAKTVGTLISEAIAHPNDPRKEELEKMEKQKAFIDDKAKALVRGELYCGLGFLIVQTLGFMRLTFWELSWDVMEPICFFVTSFHFALAYLFFLRTSTEPTFQGFFYRRFKVKQDRLMKTYQFDVQRYDKLCKAFYPNHEAASNSHPFSPFFPPQPTPLGAMHH